MKPLAAIKLCFPSRFGRLVDLVILKLPRVIIANDFLKELYFGVN